MSRAGGASAASAASPPLSWDVDGPNRSRRPLLRQFLIEFPKRGFTAGNRTSPSLPVEIRLEDDGVALRGRIVLPGNRIDAIAQSEIGVVGEPAFAFCHSDRPETVGSDAFRLEVPIERGELIEGRPQQLDNTGDSSAGLLVDPSLRPLRRLPILGEITGEFAIGEGGELRRRPPRRTMERPSPRSERFSSACDRSQSLSLSNTTEI